MLFDCPYCDKSYEKKRGRDVHVGITHKKEKWEKEKKKRRSGKYKCPYCEEFGTDNLTSLQVHCSKSHGKTSKQIRLDVFEDGEHPTCKCGCGKKVDFNSLSKGFYDYIHGHWAKDQENGFWTEEGLKKSAETRREQFESGEREPWNKGMTLDDNPDNEALQTLHEKNLKENNPERAKKISESLQGHEVSEETRRKIAESNKEAWTEEMKEEQRKKRIKWLQSKESKEPSDLENEFEDILDKFNVEYTRQFKSWGYLWDFKIDNVLIEVHGDFHHCHPDKWDEPEYDIQKTTVENDKKKKKKINQSNKYELRIFWEEDIKNNRKKVIKDLLEIIE